MTVRVLLFAGAKDAAGAGEREVRVGEPASVADVVAQLKRDVPELEALLSTAAVAVNRAFARPTTPVTAADEVAILPPVSGG